MAESIINRGRGPEIAGSRITVYDVLYESQAGLSPEEIAELFLLTVEQVQAALEYIRANRAQVLAEYQRIQERHARGDPPELQARLEATHAKYAPLFAELRRRAREGGHAGNWHS